MRDDTTVNCMRERRAISLVDRHFSMFITEDLSLLQMTWIDVSSIHHHHHTIEHMLGRVSGCMIDSEERIDGKIPSLRMDLAFISLRHRTTEHATPGSTPHASHMTCIQLLHTTTPLFLVSFPCLAFICLLCSGE